MGPVASTELRRRVDGRRGYTLIEMLVVVAIVAALSSVLAFSAMPSDAELVRYDARRLAALLELAMTESRTSGRAIAWSADPDGFAFWQQTTEGEWKEYPVSSDLRRRSLKGSTEIRSMMVDARELKHGERVVLPPYGFRGQLEAVIVRGDLSVEVRANMLGRGSLKNRSMRNVDADDWTPAARHHAT